MNQITKFRMFVVGPENVSADREGVRKVVKQLNDELLLSQNKYIEAVTWKDVPGTLGPPQATIFDCVGEYDFLVGLVGEAFGSGTEEEFRESYRRWQKTGRPRVMFYFKKIFREITRMTDLNALAKVIQFREDVQEVGLTHDYKDPDDLARKLRAHLIKVLIEPEPEKLPSPPSKKRASQCSFWPVWRDAFSEDRNIESRVEEHLYLSADESIKFLTISGRSIYSGQVEELLTQDRELPLNVRLLFFDWNSPWFPTKMRDERRISDSSVQIAREKARSIAEQFVRIAQSSSNRIQIKLYREYPVWRMLIIDNCIAYVGYYPRDKKGYEGPMLVFDRNDAEGLFYPMNQYFERLWVQTDGELGLDDERLELWPLEELQDFRNE